MKIKDIFYRESDSKQLWESQCNYDYITHLKDLGYMEVLEHAGERRIFSRPAAVIVTFMFGEKEFFYDAKENILKIYGTKHITRKQANRFIEDVYEGRIVLVCNRKGEVYFEER